MKLCNVIEVGYVSYNKKLRGQQYNVALMCVALWKLWAWNQQPIVWSFKAMKIIMNITIIVSAPSSHVDRRDHVTEIRVCHYYRFAHGPFLSLVICIALWNSRPVHSFMSLLSKASESMEFWENNIIAAEPDPSPKWTQC